MATPFCRLCGQVLPTDPSDPLHYSQQAIPYQAPDFGVCRLCAVLELIRVALVSVERRTSCFRHALNLLEHLAAQLLAVPAYQEELREERSDDDLVDRGREPTDSEDSDDSSFHHAP